jgi:hypothetical protein
MTCFAESIDSYDRLSTPQNVLAVAAVDVVEQHDSVDAVHELYCDSVDGGEVVDAHSFFYDLKIDLDHKNKSYQ